MMKLYKNSHKVKIIPHSFKSCTSRSTSLWYTEINTGWLLPTYARHLFCSVGTDSGAFEQWEKSKQIDKKHTLAQWKCLPSALTFPWGITNWSTLSLLSKGNWGQRHRGLWGFAGQRRILNIQIHQPTMMTLCPSEPTAHGLTAALISSGLATLGRSHTSKWENVFKTESCCWFFFKVGHFLLLANCLLTELIPQVQSSDV